jgi:hypothetical protein
MIRYAYSVAGKISWHDEQEFIKAIEYCLSKEDGWYAKEAERLQARLGTERRNEDFAFKSEWLLLRPDKVW